jgi:hypothetical protein
MPRKELDIEGLVNLLNKGRPANDQLAQGTMIEKIYAGSEVTEDQKITPEKLLPLINCVINTPALYEPIADLIDSRRNEAMVALINSHNPYTSNNIRDMTVFSGNPDPEQKLDNNTSQIELEVDGPYSMTMEWNFKGSPQKINKTIRIKYRYRARNLHKPRRPLLQPPHWVTAYMLIGYEDGGE